MLALAASLAVVLYGRLVTVLSSSRQLSNRIIRKTKDEFSIVLVLVLEFGHLAPKNSKKAM